MFLSLKHRTCCFWLAAAAAWFFSGAGSVAAVVDPLRLTRHVEPLAQAVYLSVDPAQDDYTGRTRVDLRFNAASAEFRLHAQGLVISSATVRDASGRTLTLIAATTDAATGLVTLTAPQVLPPGGYLLEVNFSGRFARNGMGLYKTVSDGSPYLFTQFEALHARHAFPCWDEPGFKIPWQLSVQIPSVLEVVSNAAVAYEERAGSLKTVHFGRTPPMPSYLVALAVGPLEAVPVAGLGVPGRVITPRGQTGLTGEVARISPQILSRLEEYFGIPYPYAKLDQVAVPEFVFGGMENAGLITYRAPIILVEPDRVSFRARRGIAEIVAHEIAHMWFGNLVTMAWWDDLWLNESFASWMAAKIVGQAYPEYRLELSELDGIHRAMRTDALPSVLPVRRQLQAKDNPETFIDELTYNKGQAILTMIESWIGPEKFRAAMRIYFQQHAWKNTTAEDLWRAFASATGEDIPTLIRAFMERPGIPLISISEEENGRLKITQQRFSLNGETGVPGYWQVPVVLQWSVAGRVQRHRVLVKDESVWVDLPGQSRVEWLHPNADEAGYYRWSLSPALNARLARHASALTPRERVGLLENASALLNAGRLAGDEFLTLIAAFAGDDVPEVAQKLGAQLNMVRSALVPEAQRQRFGAFAHSLLRPALQRIGLTPAAGEPDHVAPLRSMLIQELGRQGGAPEVIALARDLTERYLVNPRDVDPAIAAAVLSVAAYHGDAALWERFRVAFEAAKSPAVRSRLLAVLGAFRDPAVQERALAYTLSGPFNVTEVFNIPSAQAGQPGRRALVVDWVIQHFDALKTKSADRQLAGLISIGEGNDPAVFEKLRTFLLDPARKTQLAEVNVGKAVERMEQRVRLRQREAANVTAFLAAWSDRPPADR